MCFCLSIYLIFSIYESQNIEDQILSLCKPEHFQQPFAFTSAGGGFGAFHKKKKKKRSAATLLLCEANITYAVIKAPSAVLNFCSLLILAAIKYDEKDFVC